MLEIGRLVKGCKTSAGRQEEDALVYKPEPKIPLGRAPIAIGGWDPLLCCSSESYYFRVS